MNAFAGDVAAFAVTGYVAGHESELETVPGSPFPASTSPRRSAREPSAPIKQVSYHEAPYGVAPDAFGDSRFNCDYDLGPTIWR